jgi:hypothetical protein
VQPPLIDGGLVALDALDEPTPAGRHVVDQLGLVEPQAQVLRRPPTDETLKMPIGPRVTTSHMVLSSFAHCPTSLAWISQTYRCIGAENLRKMLCCNSFFEVQESPDADRVYAEAV